MQFNDTDGALPSSCVIAGTPFLHGYANVGAADQTPRTSTRHAAILFFWRENHAVQRTQEVVEIASMFIGHLVTTTSEPKARRHHHPSFTRAKQTLL